MYDICCFWSNISETVRKTHAKHYYIYCATFSWYYLLLVLVILFVCVYILFSRYANITLGEEGEDPEFSLPSWFAMLFSAGMGIGLVFWTTAEPISHAFKLTPIHKAGTQSAINDAMQFSFFHWGFMHGQSMVLSRLCLHILAFIKDILA